MSTAQRPAPITVEQYEHFRGYPGLRDELINGEIVMSPQAKPLHQEVARNIERVLSSLVEQDGFVARGDSNLKLSKLNSMPAPDVFVVRSEDWFRACRTDTYLDIAPLLVVEVLSPANRKSRVSQKVEIYLASGVRSVWVVDAKRKTVAVHSSEQVEKLETPCAIELPAPLHGTACLEDVFRLR